MYLFFITFDPIVSFISSIFFVCECHRLREIVGRTISVYHSNNRCGRTKYLAMRNVANKIVDRINREVGADLKNLHKCKNIVSDYQQRVGEIEAELLIENNNVPSKIKSTLAECRDVHEAVALGTEKIDQFQETLIAKLNEYHQILHGVSDQLNKIRSLQHLVDYFKILKDIQEVR